MDQETKKISVIEQLTEKDSAIEIKNSGRREKTENNKIEQGVKELYQSPEMNFFRKPLGLNKRTVGLIVVLTVVLALLAGIIGGLFILTRQNIKIPFFGEIKLRQYFPTREVTLVTEKKVTVTNDLRLDALSKDLGSKIVQVFLAKKEKESLSFLEQIYAPEQVETVAVIITNDGWLLCVGLLDQEQDYVVIDTDNQIYTSEKMILDEVNKISFLKINISNKPVIKFATLNEITSGQQVIIWDKQNKIHLTEVSYPQARKIQSVDDLIRSTDRFSDYLELELSMPSKSFPNSLIFGLDAGLIGVINASQISSAWHFESIIKQILSQTLIQRPYLGVDYLLIEEAPGLISPLFQELKAGAIIYGPPIIGSPAAKAGLRNADVITKLDGLKIGREWNLTYLIQNKKPGDQVEIMFLRAGEEQSVQITLEALE